MPPCGRTSASDGQIVEAYAYAIDRGDSKQQQFQQILRNLGFTVKLKPYIQRSDGSAKGDWDVGITLDIMDAADHVDEVVLASGDGDFDMLLERIISKHGVQGCGLWRTRPDRQLADPRRQPLRADRRRTVAEELKIGLHVEELIWSRSAATTRFGTHCSHRL
jgi:hypothetical protein